MLRALLLMIGLWAATPVLADDVSLPLPPGVFDAQPAPAFAQLARSALQRHRDDDPANVLATRFRLQMVAGDADAAIASILALRRLRGDALNQPPLYLQYEIHARAQAALTARQSDYAMAWRQAFAERFGALDDKTALAAEFSFGGGLPRMRAELDAALAQAKGRTQLPLNDAVDLIRKYQVYTSYAAFQPLFSAALAQDDARRYAIDRDRLITTPDGARIAALIVRPLNASPQPALLQFTIYANDDWAWGDAKKMAAYGYAGVVAYSRGKGRSPDAIAPYVHDGEDAAAVIDWIAAQPWNDGRVGMYGGSYSGYTQWAALKQRPKALKAIATSATTAPGIDVPMEGGIFLNFLYPWPLYAASNRGLDDARYGDGERWARLNRQGYASGRAYRDLPAIDGSANPVFLEWLRHPAYDAYWQAKIPQGEDYAGIDIPVLVTTGYYDGAQIGALHYFREHLRHRPDADHTLLIGPYEHFTMQTGVPPVVQGYAVEPSARLDLQALRLAWFDHVFRDAPKPDALADRVNWQVMGADTWRHAPTLDAMATRTQRWYLTTGEDGKPALSAHPRPEARTAQRVDFSVRDDADWQASPTVVNPALDAHAGVSFVSEPLTQDTELSGAFEGMLDFSVNKRDVDVALAIYELNARGEYLDLAYWLQRASHNADRRTRRLLEPGTPQRLIVKDTRLLGRKLAAGSRIVVTLGVIKQPDRQLNLGSGKDPSDETIADAGTPLEILWRGSSYLDLPVRE